MENSSLHSQLKELVSSTPLRPLARITEEELAENESVEGHLSDIYMYLLLTLVPSNHEGMVIAEEEEGRKGDDSTCTLNLLFPIDLLHILLSVVVKE